MTFLAWVGGFTIAALLAAGIGAAFYVMRHNPHEDDVLDWWGQ